MADDIVSRLRDIASLRGPMGGSVIPVACTEAADEIERLREDKDSIKIAYNQALNTLESFFDEHEKLLRENEILHKKISEQNKKNRAASIPVIGNLAPGQRIIDENPQ
jgi:hypothetical protein